MWMPDPRLEAPELFIPRKKPIGKIAVNNAHPDAPTYYYPLNSPVIKELQQGRDGTISGGAEYERDYVTTLTNNDQINLPTGINTTRGAILVHFKQIAKDNSSAYICEASWNAFGIVFLWGTNEVQFTIGNTNVKASYSVSVNDDMAIVGEWDSALDVRRLYINGEEVVNNSTTYTGNSSVADLTIGDRDGLTSRYLGAHIYSAAVWDGRWPGDPRGLSADPYRFLVTG